MGVLLVGDLTQVVLHAVATRPGWTVIHQVRQQVMTHMTPVSATLTYPYTVLSEH